jgi:hypothetical protein
MPRASASASLAVILSRFFLISHCHLYIIYMRINLFFWQLTRSTLAQEKLPQANGPSARRNRPAPIASPCHLPLAAHSSLLSTPQTGGLCRQKCASRLKSGDRMLLMANCSSPGRRATTYVAKNVISRHKSPRNNSLALVGSATPSSRRRLFPLLNPEP